MSDFLKKSYYGDLYFINTKENSDLVIHNDKEADSAVGAIFETKKVGYNQHSKYVALPESESPLVIESITDSHRGWFLITPDGDVKGMKGKKGRGNQALPPHRSPPSHSHTNPLAWGRPLPAQRNIPH